MEPGDRFGSAADLQSTLVNRARVCLGDVVSINLDVLDAR
jgi:hypothetical protein